MQSIEFSLVEKDVLYGLQQGNAVLTQLNKEMDLATVEKLMDDTREGIAYQEVRIPCRCDRSRDSSLILRRLVSRIRAQEVSALLSSRISAEDEEDVLAELAALQAEQVRRVLFIYASNPCSSCRTPASLSLERVADASALLVRRPAPNSPKRRATRFPRSSVRHRLLPRRRRARRRRNLRARSGRGRRSLREAGAGRNCALTKGGDCPERRRGCCVSVILLYRIVSDWNSRAL